MLTRTVPGGEKPDEQDAPVDLRVIRRLCFDVLWMPMLPTGERLDAMCEQLAGHVERLIPALMDVAARMTPDMRRLAVHCLVRAHQDLASDHTADRRDGYAYYLATSARALLTLIEHPGVLGLPAGEDEIERAVRRRICAGCCEPGEDDDNPPGSWPGTRGRVRGYRHTDSCRVVAAERRAVVSDEEGPGGGVR